MVNKYSTKGKSMISKLGNFMVFAGKKLLNKWAILWIASFVLITFFAWTWTTYALAYIGVFVLIGFTINIIRRRKKKKKR